MSTILLDMSGPRDPPNTGSAAFAPNCSWASHTSSKSLQSAIAQGPGPRFLVNSNGNVREAHVHACNTPRSARPFHVMITVDTDGSEVFQSGRSIHEGLVH